MAAPLRAIVARGGPDYATVETLECGHLHEPNQSPVYPERHLHAKRRRCEKCRLEGLYGPMTSNTNEEGSR